MKTIAVIQARINSTRLPGKAMMSLAGRPLIAHVVERIKAIPELSGIILATGVSPENQILSNVASSAGIDFFTGSDFNVLDRFYKATRTYDCDYVIRATGDNPFTDPYYAGIAVDKAAKLHADLFSFANLPLGTGVGLVSMRALEDAYLKSSEPHHFEHVTPYIKENPQSYKIAEEALKEMEDWDAPRLTVDEKEDYDLAERLYDALYHGNIFSLAEIRNYLEKNPELTLLNKHIRQKQMTESSFEMK
jgi:spore coat polysaccharide biosynthesis protein SpsF